MADGGCLWREEQNCEKLAWVVKEHPVDVRVPRSTIGPGHQQRKTDRFICDAIDETRKSRSLLKLSLFLKVPGALQIYRYE